MFAKKKLTGAAIAAAAAGLLMSGSVLADGDHGTKKHEEAKVKCAGINSCKGKTSCKSASNECKGKNSCKGKGWKATATNAECIEKGGNVIES